VGHVAVPVGRGDQERHTGQELVERVLPPGQRLLEPVAPDAGPVLVDQEEDVLLGPHVLVDEADRDVGLLGDVADDRLGEALPGHEPRRRLHDLGPPALDEVGIAHPGKGPGPAFRCSRLDHRTSPVTVDSTGIPTPEE
jgi:hypothetical protein